MRVEIYARVSTSDKDQNPETPRSGSSSRRRGGHRRASTSIMLRPCRRSVGHTMEDWNDGGQAPAGRPPRSVSDSLAGPRGALISKGRRAVYLNGASSRLACRIEAARITVAGAKR